MTTAQIEKRISVLEHMMGAFTAKAKLADKAAVKAKIVALKALI